MTVRPARPDDVPAILGLVGELADYERAAHEVLATEEQLRAVLFGPAPAVFALVVEHPTDSSAEPGVENRGGIGVEARVEVAGFALWFLNFSTWLGRHGIYLEDLYVRPHLRSYGYGKALLTHLASLCVERGYGRLEWSVLDWNEPALGFYRKLGAVPMDDWTVLRLAGEPLRALGSGSASR